MTEKFEAPELFDCPADCSPGLVDGSGEFSWPCSECGRDWTKYPDTGYPEGVTGPYDTGAITSDGGHDG
jgi:hypothetical protein